MPGDTDATLWTETYSYADLPKVLDPPTGWLQNANDPPWTCTIPQVLMAKDFDRRALPLLPSLFRWDHPSFSPRSPHVVPDYVLLAAY